MKSVYAFSDAAQYLRSVWEEKHQKNPSFSIRSWAKKLGFESHAPLNLILAGKRSLPKKRLPQFIESLGLSTAEGVYLEALIDLKNAKSDSAKSYCLEKVARLRPRQAPSFHEITSFDVIRDPLHGTLVEMSELPGFRPEPKWIQRRLIEHRTLKEIAVCLERLESVGLLKRSGDSLVRGQPLSSTTPDVKNIAVQEYHKRVCALATQALPAQPVEQRQFNGMALNIDPADLPAAKAALRAFVADFVTKFETRSGTDAETYQLSLQFFALTKTGDKHEIA